MKTYIVETVEGEKVRQPYLATADDVRHALAEWLGDMGTERDVQRIYANARALEAISWSEYGQGFKFINRFEPLDYLDAEPLYMNPNTGSVDTLDGWESTDGLVQVRMVNGQWEAV